MAAAISRVSQEEANLDPNSRTMGSFRRKKTTVFKRLDRKNQTRMVKKESGTITGPLMLIQ